MKQLQNLKFKVLTNRPNGHDLYKGDVVSFPEGLHYELSVTKNMTHVHRVKASDLELITEGGDNEEERPDTSQLPLSGEHGTQEGSGEAEKQGSTEETVAETKDGGDDASNVEARGNETQNN